RSRDRPELGAFLVVGAEADERSHDRAELLRLLGVEVAALDDLDLAVVVLLDEQQIDQPNDVVLLQAVELLHDRPVEVVALEADDQHLHGAQRQTVAAVGRDAHTPCRSFCFCTSNSASVSTPCSCSCPSLPSCSIVLSVIPPPPPPPPWACWACWPGGPGSARHARSRRRGPPGPSCRRGRPPHRPWPPASTGVAFASSSRTVLSLANLHHDRPASGIRRHRPIWMNGASGSASTLAWHGAADLDRAGILRSVSLEHPRR